MGLSAAQIILRGRQRHLYDQYKDQHRYIDEPVLEEVMHAWQEYLKKRLPKLKSGSNITSPHEFEQHINTAYSSVLAPSTKLTDAEQKIKMYIRTAKEALRALTTDLKLMTPHRFYEQVNDVMCEYLDERLKQTVKGSDHAIFLKLTREYEASFFKDMADLNVQQPDEVTRVTEYGESIAKFTKTIVDNKFAYVTSDGSVYFDIKAFEAAGNPYARLEPWNRSDKALQADGEGALSQRTTEKRSDADFALWKASKPGEPSWPSPFGADGAGRPGWHIECSAMASDRLGRQMDIHSGGIDLAFPHHDNELAQSEAFWQDKHDGQWVNYFLHMGHLSISGAKMSKSLKNFTTIKAALEMQQWTSRSLRIVFLLGNWKDGIEITDDLVKEGASWEDRVDNFFLNAREVLKATNVDDSVAKTSLSAELQAMIQRVDEALADSFDTSRAMAAISTLITGFNTATRSVQLPQNEVLDLGLFVTRIVNIFGLNGDASPDPQEIGWSGIDISEAARRYVEPLAAMRDQLRQAAIAKSISPDLIESIVQDYEPPTEDPLAQSARPRGPSFAGVFNNFRKQARATIQSASTNGHAVDGDSTTNGSTESYPHINKEILALCDKVRDVDLWSLNVYLEDRENGPALVRPVTNGLRNVRKEKEERARLKDEAKRKLKEAEQARRDKDKLDPREMYRIPPFDREFGEWDEMTGMPTKNRDGSRVSDSRTKKLKKEWEKQKERHEGYLARKRAASGGAAGTSSTTGAAS